RWITGHRIVFLRGGKCKKDEHEAGPAQREQTSLAGAIDRLERKFGDSREIDAPRKYPQEMEQPKVEAGHGVVVVRVAQIQKTEKLLVNEKEPKKTVVLAGSAMKREREIRRITKRGQDVPRGCDHEHDQHARKWMESLPRARGKELARQQEIDQTGGDREKHGHQAFKQQPNAEAHGKEKSPQAGMSFVFVERA